MKNFYTLMVAELLNVCGGPYDGTKYDLTNSCEYCGAGADPVGERLITGLNKIKKRTFCTLDREVFLDEILHKKFLDAGINCFAYVYNSRKTKLPYVELRGEATLPAFSPKTKYFQKEGECSHCKRNGHFHYQSKELHLVYENLPAELLENDVLITYERFGYSILRTPFKDSGFASPLFVVSELVKNIFEEEKIKNVTFEPVSILNT